MSLLGARLHYPKVTSKCVPTLRSYNIGIWTYLEILRRRNWNAPPRGLMAHARGTWQSYTTIWHHNDEIDTSCAVKHVHMFKSFRTEPRGINQTTKTQPCGLLTTRRNQPCQGSEEWVRRRINTWQNICQAPRGVIDHFHMFFWLFLLFVPYLYLHCLYSIKERVYTRGKARNWPPFSRIQ